MRLPVSSELSVEVVSLPSDVEVVIEQLWGVFQAICGVAEAASYLVRPGKLPASSTEDMLGVSQGVFSSYQWRARSGVLAEGSDDLVGITVAHDLADSSNMS